MTAADQTAAPEQPTKSKFALWPVAVVAVVLLIGWAVKLGPTIAASFGPHIYAATVLQGDEPAPALDGLEFVDGTEADLDAYRGKVVLIYFGFTSCTDACPTALAKVARAMELLDANERKQVALLMISVDPERDTPDKAEAYASAFDPAFHGLTGSPEALGRVAAQYGIYYAPSPTTEPDETAQIDHTNSLMAIDPGGTLRLAWPPLASDDQVAADIAALLD